MDCDEDDVEGVPFPQCAGTRDPNGYAGSERTTDGHVRLQKRRPLSVGLIRCVMVSNPANVLPPFGMEESSTIEYPYI